MARSMPLARSRTMRSAPLLVCAVGLGALAAVGGRLNRTAIHCDVGENFHEPAFGIELFSPVGRLRSSKWPAGAGVSVPCAPPRPPCAGPPRPRPAPPGRPAGFTMYAAHLESSENDGAPPFPPPGAP